MDRPTRRRLLRVAGLGAGGFLAGCPDRESTSGSPGDNATPTPAETVTPSTSETPADGASTVHLLTDYAGPDWQARWEEELAPRVADELGVTLAYEFLGFSIHHEKRQRVEGLREQGTPPEAITSSLWSEDVGYFLAKGWLAPVTRTVDTLEDRLGPLLGDPATVAGEHYVVPHAVQAHTIHYRADVLSDLGLDPPTTLEGLLHNARVIDDETEFRGFAFPRDPAIQRPLVKLLLNAHGAHLWRWADDAHTHAEVWFPQSRARETVEYLRALAATSWDRAAPDSPGSSFVGYGEGKAAQLFAVNALGASVAAEMGNEDIVNGTELVSVPRTADREPYARGQPGFDGFLAFAGTDGRAAVDDVLEFLYRDPERTAGYYGGFPTLYLPAWRTVVESDRYRGLAGFQKHPHLLELVDDIVDDVVPRRPTSDRVVLTPATAHAEWFALFPTLLDEVLVDGRPLDPAVRDARSRLAERLADGQRLWRQHT